MSETIKNREWLLYITIDQTNGWVYGGYHHGNRTDKYIGSGLNFTEHVYKHGRENFYRRWLKKSYPDRSSVKKAEVRLIRHLHAFSKGHCYNIHAGGTGGDVLMYGTIEQKLSRNKAITEGKLAQYAQGFTERQKQFFSRHSKHLKYRNQNDKEFKQKMDQAQCEKGKRLSFRIKTKGLTTKEIARNKAGLSKQYYSIKVNLPTGNTYIISNTTNTELMQNYNFENEVVLPLIRNGSITVKRRTSRTKHNLPTGTVLKFLGYLNPNKLKSNSIVAQSINSSAAITSTC
jgi:hypothetical protein